jgi:hypothetical protein
MAKKKQTRFPANRGLERKGNGPGSGESAPRESWPCIPSAGATAVRAPLTKITGYQPDGVNRVVDYTTREPRLFRGTKV